MSRLLIPILRRNELGRVSSPEYLAVAGDMHREMSARLCVTCVSVSPRRALVDWDWIMAQVFREPDEDVEFYRFAEIGGEEYGDFLVGP